MIRSRLLRRNVQKTKKNLVLSVLGIIVIIVLLLKFGIPLLINLSLFLSGSQNRGDASIQKETFIAPPVLDSFPEATSSANIFISGIASEQQTIDLYINDNLVNTSKTNDEGKFTFEEKIEPGENVIKAKAVIDGKESEFSNTITTIYKSAPPSLKINSPSDGQAYSRDQNTADVKGITDSDVKVTVNGLWAITDGNGVFSYSLPLQNGENKIKIIATDLAGNKSESEIKVTYSP
jgi:hypothetical protein